MSNPVMARMQRDGQEAVVSAGSLAVVDPAGQVLLALGDVDTPVIARSTAKVLQALALVSSGAADELGLTADELAFCFASHSGEERHVAMAQHLLDKFGIDADVLSCPPQWPLNGARLRAMAAEGEAPTSLHHNCSGEHIGFLGLARAMSAGLHLRRYAQGYAQPDHPVMQSVGAVLARVTGCDLATVPVQTDWCSAPTYAFPLRHLAMAYARLATGQGLNVADAAAARRLRAAAGHAPDLVAGTDRFDTDVMTLLRERVLCKAGAEGVYCAALPDRGLGVALKIDDATDLRVAEVVMAAALAAFVPTTAAEAAVLQGRACATLTSRKGAVLGTLRVDETVVAALQALAASLPLAPANRSDPATAQASPAPSLTQAA